MFEEKDDIKSDLLMRTVLENAQESVPEHVWDGVAAGLDKAARGKVIASWWRRAAVAGAAAAAAAVVLLSDHDTEPMQIVPVADSEELIAVVGQEDVDGLEDMTEILIAEARETAAVKKTVIEEVTTEEVTTEEVATEDFRKETAGKKESTRKKVGNAGPEHAQNIAQDTYDWDEPEDKTAETGISLVISGIAGTNGTSGSFGRSFVKKPSFSASPVTTGIRESDTKSTFGIPVSAGIGIKLDFNPKWSLGTGISYTFLSRKFSGTYTKVSEEGLGNLIIPSDISNTQHYIGIPVNVYYNILDNRYVNFYAYAGGAVEMCLADRYEVLSASIIHKEDPKGVQLSAGIGIGVEFMLGKHAGLYIDPSLRYYFNNNQPKSIRTVQPLMLGFEMGMRFRL